MGQRGKLVFLANLFFVYRRKFMVYNTLDDNIKASTFAPESNLIEMQANIYDLQNQIAQVGAAAGATQKEMEELVKAISEVSMTTCSSANEAGNAFRSLMYKMQNEKTDIYSRMGDIEQTLQYNYATRAETSDKIDNLELKMPFQIFDTNFEVEGIPMKIMMDKSGEQVYIMPTNPDKPIKLVFENESLDDWYERFIKGLEL